MRCFGWNYALSKGRCRKAALVPSVVIARAPNAVPLVPHLIAVPATALTVVAELHDPSVHTLGTAMSLLCAGPDHIAAVDSRRERA